MDLVNFVYNEFEKIILKDLKQQEEVTAEEVSHLLKQLLIDDETAEFIKFCKKNRLQTSLFYANQLHFLYKDELSKVDFLTLEKIIENNPKNKLAVLIWIVCKNQQFRNDEFFDIELADFYSKVFIDHSFIIDIDDILQNQEILNIKHHHTKWNLAIFEPILIKAIKLNPFKFAIHELLIKQYYLHEKFTQALSLTDTVKQAVNIESYSFTRDFAYPTFIEILEYRAAILYKTGLTEEAFQECNYIINHLPTIEIDDNIDPYYDGYIETLLIRASINLERNNKKEVLADLEIVFAYRGTEAIKDWYSDYKSLIDYAYSLKNLDDYKWPDNWWENVDLDIGNVSINKPKK